MSDTTAATPTVDDSVRYDLAKIWADGAAIERLSKEEASKQVVFEAWRGLVTSPLTTVITIITMAIALFVFSGFLLIVNNIGGLFDGAHSETSLSVFLRDGISPEDKKGVENYLQERPEIGFVSYRSKETALESFKGSLGAQSFILEGLEKENPLPASFEIKFKKGMARADIYESIANHFSANNAVEYVHYNRGLVGNLAELMRILRLVGIAAIILMLVVTSFIIGNTIQLSLYARREEIEIMRLVGAVDSFIRAPYLLEGLAQGFLGFLLAMLTLWLTFIASRNVVTSSQTLSLMMPDYAFINTTSVILVLVLGLVVGFVGSALAVRRFLNS